ncbi:MAG: pyruvate kinase [Actinobacteria bacterium]|nr:pyruvate kinase [Actinomycetota bacterium]
MTDALIVWIADLGEDGVGVAGSKIAKLGSLRTLGVKVPRGFALTTHAYLQFIRETGLRNAIERFLGEVDDPDDIDQVEAAAESIRRAFHAAPIPPIIGAAVEEAYELLSDECRDLNVPVAVRSSATGEDGAEASFAGQFETVLGVSGVGDVLDAVKVCWASLYNGRAVSYRLHHDLDHASSPMAVGIIELIHARSSGVAFSIHPVSGKRDRMVIEANWGWGEAVVQGLVTPDHVEIGKSDRRVLTYQEHTKVVVSSFDYSQGRVVQVPMPSRLANRRVLDEEELDTIVDAVLEIEAHYGYPVDVEWVIGRYRRVGEPVVIVQTRPETVHAPAPSRARLGFDVASIARRTVLSRSEDG